MKKPTDKQRHLLMFIRSHGGKVNYLSSFHSGITVFHCEKNGWLIKTNKPYCLELTDGGYDVLGPEKL